MGCSQWNAAPTGAFSGCAGCTTNPPCRMTSSSPGASRSSTGAMRFDREEQIEDEGDGLRRTDPRDHCGWLATAPRTLAHAAVSPSRRPRSISSPRRRSSIRS
jgi:hypothetical protein